MTDENWSDAQMLQVLDLIAAGYPLSEVARRVGRSKASVSSIARRIKWRTDEVDRTPHLNGSMPRRWWREGLEVRAE